MSYLCVLLLFHRPSSNSHEGSSSSGPAKSANAYTRLSKAVPLVCEVNIAGEESKLVKLSIETHENVLEAAAALSCGHVRFPRVKACAISVVGHGVPDDLIRSSL